MTFERQFVIASRALAVLGVSALAAAGAVGPVYLVISLVAVLWTGLLGWRGRGHGLGNRVANVTSAAAMVLIFAPVVLRGAPPIAAIAEFLLVLTALRALAADGVRDWIQIYALSFFELVAASALTVEPAFAAVFVLYLLLAPWALVLLCLRGEVTGQGAKDRLNDPRFVDASLFRSVAGVTVVLFLSTLAVFVFFPRMGAGLFASPFATGGGLTGFSDEVGLGDVTALKVNDTVAMRVTVDRPERLGQGPQYWRGAALDTFDGERWRRGRHELRLLSRTRPGVFVVEGRRPRDLLWQEIILEPMENPTIFFLGDPVQLQGRFPSAMIDVLGNVRTITPPGSRIRYEVLSSMAPRTDPPTERSREVPDVDPRLPALAREIAGTRRDPAAQAQALVDWFHRSFRYTTEPGDPGEADPLARFLFDTRAGHCEYFASSLAVLLRVLGTPSVVVNGYLGGEWNPYGDYLVLRQSDAHSWVEAWIDGRWRRFDPTPPAAGAPSRGPLWDMQAMLDAWRMRWYRYVINYNLQDQVEITLSLRNSSRVLWRGLTGEFWREGWERLRRGARRESGEWSFVPVAVLVMVLAAVAAWTRRRRRRAEAALGWATVRYRDMLRLLERRGLRRRPADTPEEFFERISPKLDADREGDREIVEQVTAIYQEARFSGRAAPEARAELERLLSRLEERP